MPICANRTGKKMDRIQGLVIHYVDAAGGHAQAVRNNFIKWANQVPVHYASAHDIIDLNGDKMCIRDRCNGGLTLGAIAVADKNPAFSFKIVENAIGGLRYMLP